MDFTCPWIFKFFLKKSKKRQEAMHTNQKYGQSISLSTGCRTHGKKVTTVIEINAVTSSYFLNQQWQVLRVAWPQQQAATDPPLSWTHPVVGVGAELRSAAALHLVTCNMAFRALVHGKCQPVTHREQIQPLWKNSAPNYSWLGRLFFHLEKL